MKKEDFEKLTNGMQEKLGKENSSLIADDIGTLITDNNLMLSQIEKQQEEINKLKTDKENLINTNGNLLQQISMGVDEPKNKVEKEKTPEKFSFKSCFDEKGNFIK